MTGTKYLPTKLFIQEIEMLDQGWLKITCLGKVGKNERLFSITAKNDSLISVKQNNLDDIAQRKLSDDEIDLYFDMQSAYLMQYINFYGLTLEDRLESYEVDWHWTLRFHNYWGRVEVEEVTEDD